MDMRRIMIGGVLAGIGILTILIMRVVVMDASEGTDFVYHVLLAGPDVYGSGVYMDEFEIPAGNYRFKFVPNGSSPQNLDISLSGDSLKFSEEFILDGTLHKSPISEYYTWDYSGQKEFSVPAGQVLDIVIDPRGQIDGTVSVFIAIA